MKCPFNDGWEGTPEEYLKHYDEKHSGWSTTRKDLLHGVESYLNKSSTDVLMERIKIHLEGLRHALPTTKRKLTNLEVNLLAMSEDKKIERATYQTIELEWPKISRREIQERQARLALDQEIYARQSHASLTEDVLIAQNLGIDLDTAEIKRIQKEADALLLEFTKWVNENVLRLIFTTP